MKVKTRVILVLTMIAALLASTPGGVGAQGIKEDPANPEGIIEEDINQFRYWQEARADLGLSADEDTVRQLAATEVGAASVVEFSMPLTQEERQRFIRRIEIGEDAALLMERFEKDPNYGGLYLSDDLDGRLTVNTVGQANRQLETEVQSALRHPSLLQFKQVDNSFAELQQRAADLERTLGDDSDFVEVYVDEITNDVVVGFATKQAVEKFEAVERANTVRTEITPRPNDGACTSRDACGSGGALFRGGIRIENALNQPCTTGFSVNKPNGNAYVTTAGHCDNTSNKEVEIGGQPHEAAHNFIVGSNLDVPDTETDVVLAGIYVAESSNWIFRTSSAVAHPITSVKPGTWYPTNSTICIAAKTTYYRCGKVIASSVTFAGTAHQRTKHVKWRYYEPGWFPSTGGASGGPIFRYYKAQGTHSASGHTYLRATDRTKVLMYASKIQTIQDDLNVTVKTS